MRFLSIIAVLIGTNFIIGQGLAAETYDPFATLLEKMRGDTPQYAPSESSSDAAGGQAKSRQMPTINPHIHRHPQSENR